MDAAVVKVPLYSKLLYVYSHVINIINAGLKKSPIQSSRESRFSCEASNFSSVLTCSTMGKDPGKSSSS